MKKLTRDLHELSLPLQLRSASCSPQDVSTSLQDDQSRSKMMNGLGDEGMWCHVRLQAVSLEILVQNLPQSQRISKIWTAVTHEPQRILRRETHQRKRLEKTVRMDTKNTPIGPKSYPPSSALYFEDFLVWTVPQAMAGAAAGGASVRRGLSVRLQALLEVPNRYNEPAHKPWRTSTNLKPYLNQWKNWQGIFTNRHYRSSSASPPAPHRTSPPPCKMTKVDLKWWMAWATRECGATWDYRL